MKFKSIISITVVNSLVLFVFGSLLSSCDKRSISKTGYFSKTNQISRSIASVVPTTMQDYAKFQDPKQLIIYCSLNSLNVDHCYKVHLKDSVSDFIRQTKNISPEESIAIIEYYSFEKVNNSLNSQISDLKFEIHSPLKSLLAKQKIFCKTNAQKHIGRCIEQFIQRDTMNVLNKFQFKHTLNGHEYLYVKNIIEKEFQKEAAKVIERLESSKKSI